MKTADYHVHTPLCRHATGDVSEYVKAAVAEGLDEIGFADHNPMPEPFDDWRMLLEEFPLYLEQVREARDAFPEIQVKLGMECDFIRGREDWIEELAGMADFDYLIGSVHYIAPGWAVDDPRWIGKFKEESVEEIWGVYWECYRQCAASGLFDILAHPDLVKKFGHRPAGDPRRYYEPTIAAASKSGAALEINTAGLRKPVAEMYPSLEFLRMARDAGVPIVISSDAHAPGEVGADFDKAIQLAREAGYTETAVFTGRERETRKLPFS